MSGSNPFEVDDLLQIGTIRMELRKEKDMLRGGSRSKSGELIRDLDVKSLSEARIEDGKYIQELEREVQSCSEEIGTLQDQLNLRNIEANWLGEHVHSLELKLTEMGKLQEKVNQLRGELLKSNSERLFLKRDLENKEVELQNSTSCIEKLEGVISSITLDSECEIQSMKLDLINLEQMFSEARRFEEEMTQEMARRDWLIEEFTEQIQDLQKANELLEEENRDLRNKVETSKSISKIFAQKVEEYLNVFLEKKDRSQFDIQSFSKLDGELHMSMETSICDELLGPLLSKLAAVVASDETLKDEMGKMSKMSQKIHEYDFLVEQLKDELREEKQKAKEEAEDLTQEMAELRYQITSMLEEECKRRAHIEQVSLQRITELEAQVQKELKKSFLTAKHLLEVQKLAESKSTEIQYLRKLLEGAQTDTKGNEVRRCEECNSPIIRSSEKTSEADCNIDNFLNEDTLGQLSIVHLPFQGKDISVKIENIPRNDVGVESFQRNLCLPCWCRWQIAAYEDANTHMEEKT